MVVVVAGSSTCAGNSPVPRCYDGQTAAGSREQDYGHWISDRASAIGLEPTESPIHELAAFTCDPCSNVTHADVRHKFAEGIDYARCAGAGPDVRFVREDCGREWEGAPLYSLRCELIEP